MKTRNTNRVNMINTTVGFCDVNATATAGISGFASVLTIVKGKVVLINSLNQIADGKTTGVTLDTKGIRKAMTDLAFKCGRATLAFANANNNHTLAAQVDYTESQLNGLKKEEVDDICETIHDATNTNIIAVSAFGVTAGDVTDLQTSIDLYRTASQNPRNAIIGKSQAKKKVDELIHTVVDDLLHKQLDNMADTLKTSHADFYNGYKQAREIIDLGSTPARVYGTTKDGNDAPVKDVLFEVFETGTSNKIADTKTDVKGKFSITKFKAGDFDFKFSKEGYKTITETGVHIAAGKNVRRKIVMDAAIVREGDLNMGQIANIDITGLTGDQITKVIMEVAGSTMRFYATNNLNNGPGAAFIDVPSGTEATRDPNSFTAQVGFGNGNGFLNVQNVGGGQGHWKIAFEM